MFHKASIRLTGLYLAIIMLISLCFSASIYQLSLQEFNRGLRGGPQDELRIIGSDNNPRVPQDLRVQIMQGRDQRFEEAKDRVLNRLIIINLLILAGGGFLSYYLALRTLKPIEEAHDAQSRFTADASHELRTPITAMRTENEVSLLNPKLTLPQAKQQLRSNVEELEKLTDLTEGLLRLANGSRDTIKKVELQPEILITKAVNRVLSAAEAKNILIKQDATTEQVVYGDESSLVEALVVLIDNAVKYRPEKTEVTISAAQEQKQIVFTITDKGIGIKPKDIPYVFDRFYRADSARSKQQADGYGLGLAIAKSITDMHNGSLTVASKPSKGSVFKLAIPSK